MIDGQVEINWKMLWGGFEFVGKRTKILRVLKQPFPLQIMTHQKQNGVWNFKMIGKHDNK
jgi:hypothetical protein